MFKTGCILFLSTMLSVALATDAKTLVASKCAACHGKNMEKQALGKSKITNTLPSAEIKKNLEGYRAGTLNLFGMGATMHGIAKTLTDAEIADLAKYIPTLKQ